jgi:hypothetical protein
MFEHGPATHCICLFWLESRKKKLFHLTANPKVVWSFQKVLVYSLTYFRDSWKLSFVFELLFRKVRVIFIADVGRVP